ncbi:MAG: hypothetical protein WCL39_08875 [Armatimonadota bacterium]
MEFPRTDVGGVSVSRMVIGTNWFLGFSHCTHAKDNYLRENVRNRRAMADILEVFLNAGVDTLIGLITEPPLIEAMKEAEDRTGRKIIVISTPFLPITPETIAQGLDMGEVERTMEEEARLGVSISLPHSGCTDRLLDRCTGEIRQMDKVVRVIRQYGMVPGLSTHMPESIIFADETGLDVETYISIYNSLGFLMPIELDWTTNLIRNAKKPVLTIKPMAAGQLRPFPAFTFVWNTIRDQDMVAVGTMSPLEAKECIEISLSILENRRPDISLQTTRSKQALKTG